MARRKPAVTERQAPVRQGARAASWFAAWLGLLLGLGMALLTQAPARWLAPWIAASGQLQLLDAQGTVWQGSGRLLLTGGPGSRDRALLPERIEWRLGLNWNAVNLDLKARCCMSQPLRISLGWEGGAARLSLADQQSLWPADILSGLGTPWNTLKPSGTLQLQTQGLHWRWNAGQAQLRGAAMLDLQNLGSALSTVSPMGNYRLNLQAAQQVQVTLTTVEGALQLQGQGQWLAGRWRFQGQASTEPALEPALGNVLNIIGRREGARSNITIG